MGREPQIFDGFVCGSHPDFLETLFYAPLRRLA